MIRVRFPFPLDTPCTRLARGYLRIAANKPMSRFSTGQPLGFIDALALDFLVTREMVLLVDGLFQATPHGVASNQQFLENGR